MKTLFFLLFAAALFLFSCASVQDKGEAEYTESIEEKDAATDIFADEGEGEALFEAESETVDAVEVEAESTAAIAAPGVQRRNPSQRAVPLGQGRPRPIPRAEQLPSYARGAVESSAADIERRGEAALFPEEEQAALGEEETSLLSEAQTAPPRKMPRPQPPGPAQAVPLVSGDTEEESQELLLIAETSAADEEQPFAGQLSSDGEVPSDGEEAFEDEGSEMTEEWPPPPEPSRSVSLSAGQNLEVWYPGQGWVFSGFRESSSPGGMAFSSRRFENRDTIFSFRALQPGTYILDFSRFDVLTGGYIEDSLMAEVLAEDAAFGGDEERAFVTPSVVRAPDYEGVRIRAVPQETQETLEAEIEMEGEVADEPSVMVIPARPEPSQEEEQPALEGSPLDSQALPEAAEIDSRVDESETLSEISPIESESEADLDRIRAMIEAGDIESVLSALDRFFAEYAVDTDEALFLLGQALEADSPYRDIRGALSAYETLTQNYPLSRFWQAADRRIRYIRRFYFDMR